MPPLRPALGRSVAPGYDRYGGVRAPARPSEALARCMFPGGVCAPSPRSGGRAPRCYAWRPRLGRRATSPTPRLPAAHAGQTSLPCPHGQRVGCSASGIAQTTPATAPLLGAPCPGATAVAARRTSGHHNERDPLLHALRVLWPCGAEAPDHSAGAPAHADRPETHRGPGGQASPRSAACTRLWSGSDGSETTPPGDAPSPLASAGRRAAARTAHPWN
jgi:hypothetical protein